MKPCLIAFAAAAFLAAIAVQAQSPAPSKFPLDKKAAELSPVAQAGLERVIAERLGTPSTAKLWDKLPIDFGAAIDAARPAGWRFRAGHASYLSHCAGCHGAAGDGNGPRAAGLDPLPRDFRLGVFKWQSRG